jgi:spoIIIJ-associated protein
MKRIMEITAKSPEEAQDLVKKEMDPQEKIIGSEVLSAPTKGIFGIVGSPEYRIRFTLDSIPEPEPEPEPEYIPEPAPRPAPMRSAPMRAARQEAAPDEDPEDSQEADDLNQLDEPGEEQLRAINAVRHESGRQIFSVEFAGDKHPEYTEICEIIREVARNIGVNEIGLNDIIGEETWTIDASGENISQLIGKHGRTLDALQFLLNIIANKKLTEKKVKLVLDVQGYRDQRQKGLIRLANRMCRKAMESGRQVELEPMSTVDRRTIHLTLKDNTGVETFSKGVEPLRRVVISPKRPKNTRAGGWRTAQEPRQPRPERQPASSKSVPMFMEEDGSNDS